MASHPGRLAALTVVLLLAPAAMAGTEDDPEVRDPGGDASIPLTPTPGAQDALDIVAAWVEEGNETVTFSWKVAALAEPGSNDRFEYSLEFIVGPTGFLVQVWRQFGDTVRDGGLWGDDASPCAHTGGMGEPAALRFDDQRDVVALEVPRACVAADGSESATADGSGDTTFSSIQARTFHCIMRQGNVCISESYPDETDQGRDFVLAAGVQPFSNATQPPPQNAKAPLGLLPWLAPMLAGVAALWRRP